MAYERIIMDGTTYRVRLIYDTMRRHFDIIQGPNAGPMLAGNKTYDDAGTGFTYQMAVEQDPSYPEDYYAFYEAITTPGVTHTVTVPYNDTTLTYAAKILSGDDVYKGWLSGHRVWAGLVVQYEYVAPQKEVT